MKVVFRCPPELKGLIPEPIMARRGLPDWLKNMPSHVLSGDLGLDIETAKQCPPFVDAMSGGFLMPLAADITVENGKLSWQWDLPASPTIAYPRAPVSFHVSDQLRGSPLFESDSFAVKFTNYWTASLSPGIGFLCTHPAIVSICRSARDRPGAQRYLRELHSFPSALDRSGLQRRPAPRYACGTVLPRATGASGDGGGGNRRHCTGAVSRGGKCSARRSGGLPPTPPYIIDIAHRSKSARMALGRSVSVARDAPVRARRILG